MNLGEHTRVFYDGECGLCHKFVRFVALRVREDCPIFFSSQQGDLFTQYVQNTSHFSPDTIVVYDPASKQCYTRGNAILSILNTLGGKWRILSKCLRLIPLCFLDGVYFFISKIRHRFGKPKRRCPMIPERLRKYFKD